MSKGLFSKILVVFIIAANVAFTVAVLRIFRAVGSEPATLIAAWFAFTTGELFLLSKIKREKIRKGETHDKLETKIE